MDFGWPLPSSGYLATRENLILVAREVEAGGSASRTGYAALWKMTPSV
jgi:hypothetical protein